MCDGVVPTDSSWSMSGHQESVGVHVDAHSQHVGFDLVSWCGPFRHTVLHHHEGPIILPQWPQAPFIVALLATPQNDKSNGCCRHEDDDGRDRDEPAPASAPRLRAGATRTGRTT